MKLRLLQEWNDLSQALGLHRAPAVQRREMRRAFYAGALCAMDALSKAMSGGDDITEEDMQVVKDFQEELVRFQDDMRRGIA